MPAFAVDIKGNLFVGDFPQQTFKVLPRYWLVYFKGDIVATFGR